MLFLLESQSPLPPNRVAEQDWTTGWHFPRPFPPALPGTGSGNTRLQTDLNCPDLIGPGACVTPMWRVDQSNS